MTNRFEFNHIDNNLTENEILTLKIVYKYYHKKFWCYKQSHKKYKKLEETITISSLCLVITGTIAGGVTLNPIILGVINGAGVVISTVGKMKNYKKKIETTKLPFLLMKKF